MMPNAPHRSPVRASRRSRRELSAPRAIRTLAGYLPFALLGLAILAAAAAVSLLARGAPDSVPSGPSGEGSVDSAASSPAAPADTCGGAGTAVCPDEGGVWIPLKSTAAGDVVAAARQSALFRNHQTDGDGAHDLSRLGAPVFVRALRPAGMNVSDAPDFYVIPVLDAAGATTEAAELELNPQHTAIHVIAIVSYNVPRLGGAIAQMRAEDAAMVAARAHLAMAGVVPPALVYFPADATAQQTGQIVWRAGGEFPADPLWLVTESDGRLRVVGADGAIYTLDQLPMQR